MYSSDYVFKEDHRLANRCCDNMYAIVSYLMRQAGLSKEDIEDCTQGCLLKFWKHFGSMSALAKGMEEKKTWIMLCTKRCVLNYCRMCRRRMECVDGTDIFLDCVAPGQSHQSMVICHELTDRIEYCLQKLLPEQYEVIVSPQ